MDFGKIVLDRCALVASARANREDFSEARIRMQTAGDDVPVPYADAPRCFERQTEALLAAAKRRRPLRGRVDAVQIETRRVKQRASDSRDLPIYRP